MELLISIFTGIKIRGGIIYQLDYYTFFFMVILPIIAIKSKSGEIKIICFVIFLLFCIYEMLLISLLFSE